MDRRVKRTRKRLKESLVEILKDKCVEDITVSEFAEKADINRGTFYTHYRDAKDLLEAVKGEFFEEVEKCFRQDSTREGLEMLFNLVEQNSEFIDVLMDSAQCKAFLKSFKSIIKDGCKKICPIEGREDNYVLEYNYNYIVGGICNIIFEWLEDGGTHSSIEMAIITEIFIMTNIKTLQ